MGEAKRKREHRLSQGDIDQFIDDSKTPGWKPGTGVGKYTFEFFVTPLHANLVAFVMNALAGHEPSLEQRIAFDFIKQIDAGASMLCFACDTEITRQNCKQLAVTSQLMHKASALISGICDACARKSDDELKRVALSQFRGVWEVQQGSG